MSVLPENYFVVSGWMVSGLGLKGNELMVFAIIYGFCQGDNSSGQCTASLQYFADFIGTSKVTIIKVLKSLTSRELIIKSEEYRNSVKFTTYKINLPVVKKLNWGSKETLPNNIIDNISINNNIGNNTMSETSKIDKRPAEIVDMFNSICVSYIGKQKIRLTDKRRDTIKTRLKTFTVEDFKTVFENAESSDYLKGNISNFKASFDWLIANDNNFAKTLEGNYANRKSGENGINSGNTEKENSTVWGGIDFSDIYI